MEPGSPEMKRFRDLPYPSLNEALKAETRLAVKLSEVGKLCQKKKKNLLTKRLCLQAIVTQPKMKVMCQMCYTLILIDPLETPEPPQTETVTKTVFTISVYITYITYIITDLCIYT